MTRTVVVTTGARLHFGLYGFGDRLVRRFGGAGVMVDWPLVVRATWRDTERRAERSGAVDVTAVGSGSLVERAVDFAKRWWEAERSEADRLPVEKRGGSIAIEVPEGPDEHVGLGLGTQLGMAVSAALFRLVHDEVPGLERCAVRVGRGLRSAVGSYGFFYGGMIVDQGKRGDESLSPLQARLDLPDDWRWVLLRPAAPEGLFGEAEREAFAKLPSMDEHQTDALRRTVAERLIPAAAAGDFAVFSETLYDYGRRAGEAFASVQGGAYRNASIAAWVDRLRAWRQAGVGQSSWGPTLFAVCDGQESAEGLVERIRATDSGVAVRIVRTRRSGARIESMSDQPFARRTSAGSPSLDLD